MNENLREKLYGAIFGYAVGDALGLGTEFMTVAEAARRYPAGLTNYSQIVRDAHRSQWRRGDWTNDTEVLIRISEAIMENGDVDRINIARHLVDWYNEDPVDLMDCMRWAFSNPDYLSDPVSTARNVWVSIGRFEASNEALGRALIGAMLHDNPAEDSLSLVKMTHYGSHCYNTALVITRMAYDLLWNGTETPYEELVKICEENDESTLPFLEAARYGSLEDLHLDDPDTYWYTRRSMSAALWAVWHCESMEDTLSKIIMAGGDADTNAALAAALMGLKLGYKSIPPHLIETLMERARLEEFASRWADFIIAKTSNRS